MPNWAGLLEHVDHRPYPLPAGSWPMTMSWADLLFAHWPISIDTLRPLVPAGLRLDTFDGEAWIGVVPFRMEHVGPRGLNWLPGVSAFAELNVRTYVVAEGRPGVWFLSLDAASRVAVRVARASFHLPYFDANMRCVRRDHEIEYCSERDHAPAPPGRFVATYRGIDEAYTSSTGSLEHWLTERYCLYAADRRGNLYRGEIHHAAWPLRHATANIEVCTVTDSWGIGLPNTPPLLHFVDRIDVVAQLPTRA